MKYRLVVPKPIQKHVGHFPEKIQKRIFDAFEALTDNPRPNGSTKLKGVEDEYRIRVGDYRIRYQIDDEQVTIYIIDCDHRKDVYRD